MFHFHVFIKGNLSFINLVLGFVLTINLQSILQNLNAKLFSFEYSKKIYVSYIALQICLLDQTAYLVLLAVYVSCADRWLLCNCILCPCVYLTIGMLSYSYTFTVAFFVACICDWLFIILLLYARDHTHRDKGLINYTTIVCTLYVTPNVVDKK